MKHKVNIEVKQGDSENSKIFVMTQNISGLSFYERTKAINYFIYRETKVLEQAIDNHLREFFIDIGVVPRDGTREELEHCLNLLKYEKGKEIKIYDRYANVNERIVGEENKMTVILEDDLLSCAIEVEIIDLRNEL